MIGRPMSDSGTNNISNRKAQFFKGTNYSDSLMGTVPEVSYLPVAKQSRRHSFSEAELALQDV